MAGPAHCATVVVGGAVVELAAVTTMPVNSTVLMYALPHVSLLSPLHTIRSVPRYCPYVP